MRASRCSSCVSDGAHRLGVLTDLGMSTPHVEASLTGCDALVLECNHDLDMLAGGDYPWPLKQRIAGRFGHLHNEAAATLLAALDTSRLQHIIAAHLSQQNNTPDKARAALARRARLRAGLDRHRRPGATASAGARCRLSEHSREQAWKSGRSSIGARRRPCTRRTIRTGSSCITATTSRRSTARSSRSSTRKGETNNRINAYVMGKLAAAGVPTHFVRLLNERESLVKAMKMIPVECVVRNVCAGSMAKRYGIEEGTRLPEPIFEFFLKSDALHDPLCNDDHIRVLGWATRGEIAQMKALTHRVNAVLKPLFANAGIDLVDYKLEFGHPARRSGRASSCWATSSRRTAAGCGTRRPARSSTRTGSAAIWAT